MHPGWPNLTKLLPFRFLVSEMFCVNVVKYGTYPKYEIISSDEMERVHVDDIEKNPDQIPGWWHVYYEPPDYEIRGRLDDTGSNIIELKCERDEQGPGATFTMTLHVRRKIEKKKLPKDK